MKKAKARKKRIFVADDHPMMWDGLRQLIANEDDLELAGEAEDGPAAVELLEKEAYDLAAKHSKDFSAAVFDWRSVG